MSRESRMAQLMNGYRSLGSCGPCSVALADAHLDHRDPVPCPDCWQVLDSGTWLHRTLVRID